MKGETAVKVATKEDRNIFCRKVTIATLLQPSPEHPCQHNTNNLKFSGGVWTTMFLVAFTNCFSLRSIFNLFFFATRRKFFFCKVTWEMLTYLPKIL